MAFRHIKDTEERLRFASILTNNIADAVVGTDTLENNYLILSWNNAAEKLYGWNVAEVIGIPAYQVIQSDLSDEQKKQVESSLNTKGFWEGEVIQKNKAGKSIHIHASVSIVKDEQGKEIGTVAVNRDISERKKIEKRIRQSEEKYRQLSATLDEKVQIRTRQLDEAQQVARIGSWNWDIKSGDLSWSDNLYKLYGVDPLEKISFEKFNSLLHPEDRNHVLESINEAAAGKSFKDFYHRIITPSGETKMMHSRGEVIIENGKVIRMMGTGQDITEQLRQMEELKKLAESDMQKNNFIAMASHELKTPITSIKGYVQLLLNAFEKEKQDDKPLSPLLVRSSLKSVDKQINRLTRIISELLDLSKIETGTLELKKEQFLFNELVIETVEDILYTNTKHQINIFHDTEQHVNADKDRISQVMINLLTNAIKYSPNSNKINIRVYQPRPGQVTFSVEDFGIGVDQDEQKKIFERFYRAQGKEEQTYPGFGIGLFIANEFVQKHGGSLDVKSEKGKGSLFSFTLPTLQSD